MTTTREPAVGPARVVRGRRGAVASPHHLATGAGMAVLRAGGSAVDAAIATNAALAVVAGHSCGLGGDAFWLLWDPVAGRAVALNGSGRSGSRATIEAARAAGHLEMPVRGPWSVTVPGAIHSWGAAHGRYGRLPWATLLQPAIELAEGFAASDGWVRAVESSAVVFGTQGDWARTYRPHGRPWRPGEVVGLPALARSLRLIAAEGAGVAYRGALGRRTAAYLAAAGAPIDPEDLASHASDWGEPLALDYRAVRALAHPPNSVGVVALQALGVLGHFAPPPPGAFDGRGWADPGWIHLGLEASRLALEERDAWVTDPDAMPASALETMLSAERLDALAARIDPRRARPPSPLRSPAAGGTVYLTTADGWGGVVSLLQSNYLGFGSGLVDPETGIAFQDRGAFFRLDPDAANALAPRKRTLHTLTPGLLLREGRPWLAHGAMGGEIQPQVFLQVVSAVVDGGSDVATAVAAPRWAAQVRRHQGPAEATDLEARVAPNVPADLAARGHDVTLVEPWSSSMGHAHALEVVTDEDGGRTFAAAADPRCEGSAEAW